jgi:ApbE superfamily uncharacterized protein (UPF0280 family)
MITSFNIHDSKGIKAKAQHIANTHWINISFGESFVITVFFDTRDLADAYAAAINGVNTVKPSAESEAA